VIPVLSAWVTLKEIIFQQLNRKERTLMLKVYFAGTILIILVLSLALSLLPVKATGKSSNGERSSWIGKLAPEITPGQWINASERALSDYRGKVVLLEFWTYGCYNCVNTIPTMNRWQKEYAGKDFAIIGVHTPEFEREKNFENVKRKVRTYGIEYAVVTDNDYKTWDAYEQQYWPVMYLIDKKGVIRYVHIGEGSYEETETMITSLISEK
jgi:thiol-disulfide isomerase/thioredoxin